MAAKKMNLAPLAITMGEPAGVGGELVLAAWLKRNEISAPPFFLIDDPDRVRGLAKALGLGVEVETVASAGEAVAIFAERLPVLALENKVSSVAGTPDPANSAAVVRSVRQAVDLALDGRASGIVTNPIHKETLIKAGFEHPGHTEYLAQIMNAAPVMMLASPGLRVVSVTTHVALREVAGQLTKEKIVATGRVVASALITDFGMTEPRLAVAALNPHGGEGGVFGEEEERIIAPAVRALVADGILATGPHPADSLFRAEARGDYDAVMCMYHDQALIPLKALDFEHGVNVTLGLPIVRTSPDHGTALALAGTGCANENGLLAALATAHEIAVNRSAGKLKAKSS
jgi:4-hydroxythreonine-4-phosphate dehydrogenase